MVRMTAAKCVSAPQLEVMLKVKQADNPEFAFLKPDNQCHAYFVWLKEEQEQIKREKETVDKAGGMDLLGMYSSSSDEDSAAEETAPVKPCGDNTSVPPVYSQNKVEDVLGASSSAAGKEKRPSHVGDDDEAAAKKAKRLKRAKLMRGHYRLQLMEGSKRDTNS